MAQDDNDPSAMPEEGATAGSRRRFRRIIVGVLGGIVLAALLAAWLSRERIADNVIAGQLDRLGLPATYEIESIGPSRQVLRHIVVGDPARPDLTVERAEVAIVPRFGIPGVGRITLVRPRLFGTWRGGKLSFGSLDKVLFTGGKEPFRMPDLDLAVEDGRGLIESDHGPIGIKVDGRGALRGGFAGELAAIAPGWRLGGCGVERASLYGSVHVTAEKPRFIGPLRLAGLDCGADAARTAAVALQIEATFDKPLDGLEGRIGLRGSDLAYGAARLAAATGTGGFTWRKGALRAHYSLEASQLRTPQAALASGTLEGSLRGADNFARFDVEGNLSGKELRLGGDLDAVLAQAVKAGEGTLAAPLVTRIRTVLRREEAGSFLTASFAARRSAQGFSLTVPQATLRGGGGDTLLAVSRFQLARQGADGSRIAGNFSTGGADLPKLSGRMEQAGRGGLTMRLTMADYVAGDASIAVPRLVVAQAAGGALGFAGEAMLSGALPGGRADKLALPIEGNWSPRAGLSLWRKCADLRFDRLQFASLALDRRVLTLCPGPGGAIVRQDAHGLRVAAGAPALLVTGRLGQTPIRIASGPIGFAVPGNLAARSLDVALGPEATASRFRIGNLAARIGKDVAGRFEGSDILLAAVPLDLLGASGAWRYADGALTLTGGEFRLQDRELVDRFQPLVSRDGTLELRDNRITARATMLEPASQRAIVRADIVHDLASGRGGADLAVDGITFDRELQPDTLSWLALGVVANAEGVVRGKGRIDWSEDAVTSTGRFSTDALDFAAAFGPVKGLSGTLEFTDLLGMVSAPDQKAHIASINPGIEVTDGEITYELRPNSQLAVKGGHWPFLGGSLSLRPTVMNFGVAETRRYALVIDGLDAARLLARMDMANLSVTGIFDGELPLVFDENGGHIVAGRLQSRPPGGNLSYVGELTYKDLSTMANFAFDTLKSLDYRSMGVEMNGALEGEIITSVKFDGIKQGTGAKRNFLTDRIARLPIRFNVNIRAPFFQLATSLRSMYDPAYVRDPRSLGLIDQQGRPISTQPTSPAGPTGIQPPASEPMP